jgi:hypothetical protein
VVVEEEEEPGLRFVLVQRGGEFHEELDLTHERVGKVFGRGVVVALALLHLLQHPHPHLLTPHTHTHKACSRVSYDYDDHARYDAAAAAGGGGRELTE